MRRAAIPIVALMAVLVGAAAPTVAGAAGRCHHVRGDHVIARSAVALVTERFQALRADDGTRYGRVQAIVGCARSTGRRRLITTLETLEDAGGQRLVGLKLAGSRVAYVVQSLSRYGSATSISGGDAIHPRTADRAPYINYSERDISGWAVTDDGAAAWIVRDATGHGVLRLRRPGGDVREVDLGFGLHLPVFADHALRWRHGIAVRSLPLTPSPNACAGPPARSGTPEVDLTVNNAALTACWRATGASLTLPHRARGIVPYLDIAGPYVAVTGDHAVVRLDLLTGSIDSIPTVGETSEVRVDEHGSLVWTDHPDPLTSTLWTRDAGGIQQVGGTAGQSYLHLSRDGSTVRADGGTVITLRP